MFNAQFYWEAHECWEVLWAALPKESPERLALQGLIQGAAALLRRASGPERAFLSLASKASKKISRARALGVDESFMCDLESALASPHGAPPQLHLNSALDKPPSRPR